jgi:hypothetical protein
MFYYIYISFFVPLTVLIPIKYAYSNYRYLTKAFKIILAFITFSAVINAVGTVLARGFHIQTTPIVHIYTPFEFAFLSLFFAEFYGKPGKNIIYIVTVAFVIFCIYNTLFIQNAMEMNSYARSVDAIILILYSMLFFLNNNNDLDHKWSYYNTNWMVAGILLYYASSLFVFIFFKSVAKPGFMTDVVWGTHVTILIIEYILFAIGFYKCKPQQTISTSR